MEVFAQEEAAPVFGGHGEDERIPDGQTMVGAEVEGGLQGRPCAVGHREAVAPFKDGMPRAFRRPPCLADEYPLQFAQHLRRKQDRALGQAGQ